jgi:hypothetical protein
MRCTYSCGSAEHVLSRRSFLGGAAALLGGAVAGASGFSPIALADSLDKKRKQILVVYLAGGSSQLETWDPKPKTDTGGPFGAIETSVPGIMISELLPRTAKLMHLMALVRGVNTHAAAVDDHGKGDYLMHTGRAQAPGQEYPRLGAVASKFLGKETDALPGYIHIAPGHGGLGRNESAFLGPRHAPLYLGNGQAPANTLRDPAIGESADQSRQAFRRMLNDRFAKRRRSAETEAYTSTYEQAAKLMRERDVFDISKEHAADRFRYGDFDFGRHCLLARRLLEAGATYVQCVHSNYDTHNENFAFHLEQVGEFDQGFSALLEDLHVRGRLEHTLVIVMSEFGRTPHINLYQGRDHWCKAWSIALAGCGIKKGIALGKTNARGTEVVDHEVSGGSLFHTYLSAVGLDPAGGFEVDGRPIQIAEPTATAVKELLA